MISPPLFSWQCLQNCFFPTAYLSPYTIILPTYKLLRFTPKISSFTQRHGGKRLPVGGCKEGGKKDSEGKKNFWFLFFRRRRYQSFNLGFSYLFCYFYFYFLHLSGNFSYFLVTVTIYISILYRYFLQVTKITNICSLFYRKILAEKLKPRISIKRIAIFY